MKNVLLVSIVSLVSFVNIQAQKAEHALHTHLDSFSSFHTSWYYANAPEQIRSIDTGLRNFEEYNLMQRNGSEFINLGNLGSASFSALFQPITRSGFFNGLTMYDPYWQSPDSIRFYVLKRPFSELSMNLGLRQELNFTGRHSQNLGKTIQYGLYFNRMNSMGYYQRQRNVVNNLSFYIQYQSKNTRYVSRIYFVYNGFKNQENGGLRDDIFSNASEGLITKSLADVNLFNALSNYREAWLGASQSIRLGYKYKTKVDTIAQTKLQPLFDIRYSLNFVSNKFIFTDKSGDYDPTFYMNYFYNNINGNKIDSLHHVLKYNSVIQSIGFYFLGTKKIKNIVGKAINIVAGAELKHHNVELMQNRFELTTNIVSVEGFMRSNEQAKKAWNYAAQAAFFLSGYNQGDANVEGRFMYSAKKWGTLHASALWNRRVPTWLENHYHSYAGTYTNNFNKVNTIRFGGTYTNQYQKNRWGVDTRLSAQNYILNSFIYWNNIATPEQLSQTINVFQVEAALNLHWRGLHFDTYVSYQKVNRTYIRVPAVYLKSSVYYVRPIFKKAMLLHVGLDMRYMSNYAANAYMPFMGQFYRQDILEMRYLPTLDLFVNAKIKTVRIFIKGNNLFQGVGQKGMYNALGYGMDERSFKFGVHWHFLD